MKFNHIGIPTSDRFDGEIHLPHLKLTFSGAVVLNPLLAAFA